MIHKSTIFGFYHQVAMVFYNTPVEIELVSEEETLDMTHVVMKLHFDNTGKSYIIKMKAILDYL